MFSLMKGEVLNQKGIKYTALHPRGKNLKCILSSSFPFLFPPSLSPLLFLDIQGKILRFKNLSGMVRGREAAREAGIDTVVIGSSMPQAIINNDKYVTFHISFLIYYLFI